MHGYSLNAVWLTFEKVVRILFTTFVGFYVVRYLGPKNFGMLSYSLAWLAILGALTGLGIDNIALRELVREPEKSNSILSTAICLKLVAAFVTLLVLFVLFLSLPEEMGLSATFIVGFALVFQPLNVCEILFQARADSKNVVQAQVIQSFVSSMVKLLLVYFSASLEWFLWSYVFDALFLAVGIYVISTRGKCVELELRAFDLLRAKSLLISAFPLLLASIATAIYMKIDLIMLESMVLPDVLGAYSAAAKLSESWYFIPVAMCTAFTPMLLSCKKESVAVFKSKVKNLYSTLVWGAMLVAAFVSIFSGQIIEIIYGEKYIDAAGLLSVHIWSGVFVCIGLVNSIVLLSHDRLYQNLTRTMLGAAINIALNLLWIPLWGGLGAAYATLVSYAFTAWLSIIFFKNGRQEFILTVRALGSFPRFKI